ncbi:hypothetical protein EN759_40380, partial [Mesorhizobium sp. M00.F.Ca.ET.038.03.1.1]
MRFSAAYHLANFTISSGPRKAMIVRLRRALRWQALPLLAGFAVVALIITARAILAEAQIADRDASREAIEAQQTLSSLLSLAQD